MNKKATNIETPQNIKTENSTDICFDNEHYLKNKTTFPKLKKAVSQMIKMDGYEDILEFCIFIEGDKKGEIYAPDINSDEILVKGRSVFVCGSEGEYVSGLTKDARWKDIIYFANNALTRGVPKSQFLVNVCFLEKINGINVFALIWDDSSDEMLNETEDLEVK